MIRNVRSTCLLFAAIAFFPCCPALTHRIRLLPQRWTEDKAAAWYAAQPWPVGANFLPSNAINELEMWQADTFDPATIDRELGWAESIGMNTMRVFLHNLLWEQDPKGFKKRIDTFLAIAARHHIKPVFVLFDSCWEPFPKLGPQHPPIPGVHNSGWVQAPGATVLSDPAQYPRLESYVKGVVGAFANDQRILAWDVWNEPDNGNDSSYAKGEPKNKNDIVLQLVPQVFAWARSAHPVQPLTSGVWHGDWSSLDKMPPMARVQIEQSDVISFHNYGWPEEFEKRHSGIAAIPSPDYLHRIHGARRGQPVRHDFADRKEISRGSDQLGSGRRQEPNVSAVGFVAAALCGSPADDLVPRCLLSGRKAVSRARSGDHSQPDERKVEARSRVVAAI